MRRKDNLYFCVSIVDKKVSTHHSKEGVNWRAKEKGKKEGTRTRVRDKWNETEERGKRKRREREERYLKNMNEQKFTNC